MKDRAPWLRRLSLQRTLARLVLLFECLWPALWPPLGAVGLFVIAALLDLPALMPVWLHIALLLATAVAVVALLIRGLWRLGVPDIPAADRRLEDASGLTHRPLATLADRPATSDPIGDALWQAHIARVLRQVGRLRVGAPHPGLARRDRIALRGALVVALFAALIIAGADATDRIASALQPSLARVVAAPAPVELRAWITPPAYTRLPPVFPGTGGGAITVPLDSRLTVSVTGGTMTPHLSVGGTDVPFATLDPTSFQAEQELKQAGRVVVRRGGSVMTAWDLALVVDQPPIAAWTEKPTRAPGGPQIRFPWKASDDYGVTTLQAELQLDARPAADPVLITIPLPSAAPKSATGINQQDLTAHPWAGLGVTGRLVARDALQQVGVSEDAGFVLPERTFNSPVARILAEIRKGLSVHPEDRTEALAALDILLRQPDVVSGELGAFTNLVGVYALLVRQERTSAIPEAQDRLWKLALQIEEGRTDVTARALEEARRAVREAMNQAQRDPTDANRKELEKRLRELREAIDRHMQAMMEQARRDGTLMDFDPESHRLTNHDMDRLADRAGEAAREGRMDEARRRVEELEELLDQMRNGRMARSQDGQQQGSNQRRQRGRQQMGAVQDMISREGALLDHSENRNDQAMRPRGVPPPTTSADADAQREADRKVQNALRRSLGEMMQQFGDLTGEIPPALTEADQAMREAASQLAQARDQQAGASQQRAIEALQKGARQMGQAMAKQFGQSQAGEGEDGEEGFGQPRMGMMSDDGRGEGRSAGPIPGDPSRANPNGRDPLGRRNQGSSSDNADIVVPEEREHARTQELQDELRRRGADRQRPRDELDYIDRLLRQF